MAEDSAQEKTEEPTARKLQKARDDGQVARSQELPGAAVMIGAVSTMVLMGGWLITGLVDVFKAGFVFDRKTLLSPDLLPLTFGSQAVHAYLVVVPVFIVTIVLAILASGATGGYLFSLKSIAPKASKINPMEGFKRMFGVKALVELTKALLKFTLVTGVLVLMINLNLEALVQIGRMPLEPALHAAGEMVVKSALYVTLSLIVIASIDVPWQKHEFMKRMRMTKQEIKDEYKDIEGRPEVKAQIRRRQREMSNQRMMANVKDADVVITDGVVGNVMIKLAEGLSKGLFQAIAAQVLETDPELAVRLEPVVKAIYAKHDYHEYGGAPLLGVNGTCLISHGSSQARTIMNAVLRCKQFVTAGINDTLVKRLATCTAAQA